MKTMDRLSLKYNRSNILHLIKKLFFLLLGTALFFEPNAQTLHTIHAGSYYFSPATLTVNVGDTVQWVNDDGFHNVNATTNTLTGASFNNPESFSSVATFNQVLLTRVFTVAGTYKYDCSVGSHAANGMTGTLQVGPSTSKQEIENVQFFQVAYSSAKKLEVQFDLANPIHNVQIAIYSMSGQPITKITTTATDGKNKKSIALGRNISSGIYLVFLHTEGVILTREIIIP